MQNRIACVVMFVLSVSVAAPAFAGTDASDVVGGRPVPAGLWPDAVAVIGPEGRCSGTLVAPDVVLTAGHCIEIDPRVVVAASVDVEQDGGEWIRVARATAYPDWEHSYDVGVLVLEHAAKTAPRAVARACTARETLRVGADVTVVGFGITTAIDDGRDRAVTKNWATIPITDATCTTDAACQGAVDPGGEIIAGGAGADACFGDSGGPAYAATGTGPVLVGVVSRGLAGQWACGDGGIYVRADKVARWIEQTTGRKLVRPSCVGGADDPDDGADDGGSDGCSAGRGAGGGGGFVVGLAIAVAVVVRKRKPALSSAHGAGAKLVPDPDPRAAGEAVPVAITDERVPICGCVKAWG